MSSEPSSDAGDWLASFRVQPAAVLPYIQLDTSTANKLYETTTRSVNVMLVTRHILGHVRFTIATLIALFRSPQSCPLPCVLSVCVRARYSRLVLTSIYQMIPCATRSLCTHSP